MHKNKLVPVLILIIHITVQRLELWTTWNGHVQRLGCVEGLLLEEIEVVLVHEIRKQLVGETVQHTLLRQAEMPLAVACAVNLL
jgi:hypothetical protein